MTRYAKRIDNNQKNIVCSLRDKGFEVKITSHIGNGFPDILIKKNGIAIGVEIKDEGKVDDLTVDEEEMSAWFQILGMKYIVVDNFRDIESAYLEMKKERKR